MTDAVSAPATVPVAVPAPPPYAALPQVDAEDVRVLWHTKFYDIPRAGVAVCAGEDVYFELVAESQASPVDFDSDAEREAYNLAYWGLVAPTSDERLELLRSGAELPVDAPGVEAFMQAWRARDPYRRPARERYTLARIGAEVAQAQRRLQERALRSGWSHLFHEGCGPIWPGELPTSPAAFDTSNAPVASSTVTPRWLRADSIGVGAPYAWTELGWRGRLGMYGERRTSLGAAGDPVLLAADDTGFQAASPAAGV